MKQKDVLDIQSFLEKYYWPDDTVILACSTWVDSMFLLYQILKTPYRKNLVVCYFNHHTREQCKLEEEFLLELWKKENFKVEIWECDFQKIQKLYPSRSFEELAREKRYQFFEAICNIYTTDKIITAHHLDDKIETFFFNLLRGSKITGLTNMQEKSWGILRPLLHISKAEIYNFCKRENITYFEDETNKNSEYSRNFLRNDILPQFEKINPEYRKNISNFSEYLEEVKSHIDMQVLSFLWEGSSFSLPDFLNLSPFLQKEVIRYIYYISNGNSTIGLSEANIAEVLKFLKGKNNKTKKEIRGMNLFKDGEMINY
jgi:tRNA(Ile)-lysidine synthase